MRGAFLVPITSIAVWPELFGKRISLDWLVDSLFRGLTSVWEVLALWWSGGVESGLDGGVDLGVGELGGYTDAIHDRFFVGGAVAYDADSADA
jgi:hypothetical protein